MGYHVFKKNIFIAQNIVEFCRVNEYDMGEETLSSPSLEKYILAMIEEGKMEECFKSLMFMVHLFHPIEEKTTELLAVRLAESLPLEQSQKKSLNNLFAKSATWEMI